MQAARAITVIPPTVARFSMLPLNRTVKKRVGAYARVSTDQDEQLSSYEAQVDYYTRFIQSNEEWEFVCIYTDEGISATNTKKRDGFKQMIADALDGKMDMIITKSVSRFARNTVDTLTTVRKLKDKGVEVYFEKENIYTLDSKGELLITIMSSLAQEESRSISENVTWGQRKRFADGKVSLPYKQFLGYEKGEDGFPKIVESEAKIVRQIYRLLLEGKTPSGIAKLLINEGIPTPSGKVKWQSSTVESILTNEKYKGDALLQKTFTIDFLNKRMKTNEGKVPQYYVENSHAAIIPPEVFDLVQSELNKRKGTKGHQSGASPFSSKLICGECGSFYGSKVWHSTSKYRRTVWQCNGKFKNENICQTPYFDEMAIKEAFVGAFQCLLQNKEELLSGYGDIITALTDTTALDNENIEVQNESDIVLELLKKCIEENATTALDQELYRQKYTALLNRYEIAKNRLKEIGSKRQERKTKRENIARFLETIKQSNQLITDFDEGLWYATVDTVTVFADKRLTFQWRDGTETDWSLS